MPFKPKEIQPDFSRLNTYLINSGIQTKNNALFQTIDLLIRNTGRARDIIIQDIQNINDAIADLLILINQLASRINIPLLDTQQQESETFYVISSPSTVTGSEGIPYFIATGETFIVPEFKQALFSMNIDNEGILEVDGFLIEVN